ncbi:MAG: dGTPase, partial [[Clostridium] innocuum]
SGVSDAFLKHYDAIMNGEFDQELLAVSKEGKLIRSLKQFAFDRVYNDAAILKLELMGNEIITFLLDRFMDALLPYDSGLRMSEIQEKYIDLLSGNYLNTYQYTAQGKADGERLYLRLLLGADFVAGMTDSYAIRLYQELKGI